MKNLVHAVGLIVVAAILDQLLSTSWDNTFVANHALTFPLFIIAAASFNIVLFIPFGFILAWLVKSPRPRQWALWSGVAYAILYIVLFRPSTSATNPIDVAEFYLQFVFPAVSAWFGAYLATLVRRKSKHA